MQQLKTTRHDSVISSSGVTLLQSPAVVDKWCQLDGLQRSLRRRSATHCHFVQATVAVLVEQQIVQESEVFRTQFGFSIQDGTISKTDGQRISGTTGITGCGIHLTTQWIAK